VSKISIDHWDELMDKAGSKEKENDFESYFQRLMGTKEKKKDYEFDILKKQIKTPKKNYLIPSKETIKGTKMSSSYQKTPEKFD
jgi:hypothetical protein